jgi:restriction system protein
LFSHGGLDVRGASLGAEGAADLWLHSERADGVMGVVRCVHWARPVGVEDVRAFREAIASRQLQRSTFATSSTFTPDARQFGRSNGITPLDGQALLALITTRTPSQQQALLHRAYDGEYWRPTCASCGQKMVERSGRRQSRPFWGCVDYPRCGFTLAGRKAA